jgi:hypothetical protein
MRPMTRMEKQRAAESVAAAWNLGRVLRDEDPEVIVETVDEHDGYGPFEVRRTRRRRGDERKLLKMCGNDREVFALALPLIKPGLLASEKRGWMEWKLAQRIRSAVDVKFTKEEMDEMLDKIRSADIQPVVINKIPPMVCKGEIRIGVDPAEQDDSSHYVVLTLNQLQALMDAA